MVLHRKALAFLWFKLFGNSAKLFLMQNQYKEGIKYLNINILLLKNGSRNVIINKSIKSNRNNINERKGEKMAVLSKPVNKVSVIPEKDASNFIREFNQNKVTKEFLKSCEKAGRLFDGRKQK